MASETGLHCVICFEEFSLRERPPVILPCGHTYVCLICSKRLKRCMECREPLFWTPPPNKAPPMNLNARNAPPLRYAHARRGYSSGPQTPPLQGPPQLPEPVPLPLPKNLVLMDMIESAERQARLLEEGRRAEESSNIADDGETSEAENEKPEASFAHVVELTGTCGTYAVRDREGLAVLPFDPNRQHQTVREEEEEEKKADESREPFTIEAGSTVQIVGVTDGVYKLARGVGFIVASVNQLVKVGGPLDEACKLEGMLESVRAKEMDLRRSLEEVQQLSDGLRDKICTEAKIPEVHPVIAHPKPLEDDTNTANDENDASTAPFIPDPVTPPRVQSSMDEPLLDASEDSSVIDLGDHRGPLLGHEAFMVHSPAHSCPGLSDTGLEQPYMEDAGTGLPCYRVNSEDEFHGITLGFGCGTALFGERLLESNHGEADSLMALSFDDSLVEDTQTLGEVSRGGVTAPIPQTNNSISASESHVTESPLRSGSFDGINFRTGMSCHRGLNQAAKKTTSPHGYRQVRMMSEHRGIGSVRSIARKAGSPGKLPSRFMPT